MKRTDFSVDWLFAACAPDTELLPWNAQFTPVDLPHDWQIRHADDLYRDGTLFYRKYFFVTDVPGTRRMLWFGGAYMDTTVFVNGTEVGQWKYGYTSFWFDITDALHEGQNEVLVRCNLRHPNSRWYSGAGLYRNVELWEAPDLHLMPDGLYVAAKEGDNGAWTVAVTAEAGSVTAASAGRTLTLHLSMQRQPSWHCRHPCRCMDCSPLPRWLAHRQGNRDLQSLAHLHAARPRFVGLGRAELLPHHGRANRRRWRYRHTNHPLWLPHHRSHTRLRAAGESQARFDQGRLHPPRFRLSRFGV